MANTIISVFALIVAIFSAVYSVITANKNNELTKRINDINIKSRYFQRIFDDYLIEKIPEARNYIRFSNDGRLLDTQELVNVLSNMRKAALFFKYDNSSFYDELKVVTQGLEDYIMECGNRSHDMDEQSEITKQIREKVEKLYATINDYYIGVLK